MGVATADAAVVAVATVVAADRVATTGTVGTEAAPSMAEAVAVCIGIGWRRTTSALAAAEAAIAAVIGEAVAATAMTMWRPPRALCVVRQTARRTR